VLYLPWPTLAYVGLTVWLNERIDGVPERLPLIVLAGSDRRQGSVPIGMHEDDMLAGFKGMLPLPGGKVLVAELIDRYRHSGRFLDPVLIGPAHVYHDASLQCEIVDCDGSIAETLQTAIHVVESRFGAGVPVGMTTCDVLPGAAELQQLLTDSYDPVSECVFWGQLIEAQPAQMGASRWKPYYTFANGDGAAARNLYPGHLVIMRAAALNIEVAITLVRLAYLYRNRPLLRRVPGMLAHGMATLARHDLRHLCRLHWSAAALNVPWQCLTSYARYRRGQFKVGDFERAFAKAFVRRAYRQAAAGRPVRFVISGTLSLAKDLDTRAEFAEVVGALSCDSD
jgi:hypothetical protein